jgi:hypothetical protein
MLELTADLATVSMLGTFSPGRINMPDEKELPADDKLLSLLEASKLLGYEPRTLAKYVTEEVPTPAGKLAGQRIGTYWAVRWIDAKEWAQIKRHPGGRPKKTT